MATYYGDDKDNSYNGTNLGDFIYGYGGNDKLNGLGGNDSIWGGDGNDTLNGGIDTDYMAGGLGNDTYLIAKNDGQDTIDDEGGADVVKFTDIASTAITKVYRVGDGLDLRLTYGSSQVTVLGYFNSAPRIEQFQFNDAVTWNWADIKQKAFQVPTDGNDILYGYDDENDVLNGLAGDDKLYAFGGNDTLNGGTGNDYLEGNNGADIYLFAKSDGQDVVQEVNYYLHFTYIYEWDDNIDIYKFTDVASTAVTQVSRVSSQEYYGASDNLRLTYGDNAQITILNYFSYTNFHTDQFQFSDGVTWRWADIGLKALPKPTSGNDILYGYNEINDFLSGLAGNDRLYGYSGNDTLNGGIGNDYMEGGIGADTYLIAKNDGRDIIQDATFRSSPVMGIHGWIEYDISIDIIKFTDIASTAITQVSSVRNGSICEDLLLTFGSSQIITIQNYFTWEGLDDAGWYRFPSWNYQYDQLQFSDGVTWNWSSQGTDSNDVIYNYDYFSSDLTVNGLSGDDWIFTDSGYDTLDGGLGNDFMDGGVGDDSYWVDSVGDVVHERLNEGNDTVFSSVNYTWVANVENLALLAGALIAGGNALDNNLTGNESANIIYGLAGNDTLNGQGGNDSLRGDSGNDVIDGGNGVDTAQYWTATSGVAVSLEVTAAQNTLGAGLDTLGNIENISGSGFNDTLTGNAFANSLSGGNGNDTLRGDDGNDGLLGGDGNDVLDGGNGIDTAHYWTAGAGVTVNLGLTAAQNTVGAGLDTLGNIENIVGSGFNDTLTGNALGNALFGQTGDDKLSGGDGNDSLLGGLGNDVLDGGNGSDWAQYWAATAGVAVNLGLAVAQNTFGAGIDTLSNFENVNGSGFNDILIGNALGNVLIGGKGNDTLLGGLGNDVLTGGLGQDAFGFNTALGINNKDTIADFNVADDTIKLENGIFTALTSTGVLAETAFKIIGNGNSVDGDDHILYNTVSGGLFYDADGNGASVAVLISLIGKGLAITQADFWVV
ncbi:MAG: calcium-binding protein [Methylovulum sp.]|uniref:calcium-binding protein n=1 Tax=Methylovulum sp. TaxID=1916980 RepID=UPI0026069433|nr:calcium-binding protein [Methylovulum sp.]MDD2722589.1 calcium-binding protein [Methylovulum sp.]MDD5123117.1 calcium-binding protein [Methylovulum sp.]